MKHTAILILLLGWALGAFAEGTTCRKTSAAAAPELVLPTDDLIRDERNCAPEALTPQPPIEAPAVATPAQKPHVAQPAAPKPHKPTIFKAAKAPKHAKKSAWAWLTLLPAGLLGLFGLRRRLKAALSGLARTGLIVALIGLLLLILGAILGLGIIYLLGGLTLVVGLVIFIVGLVSNS